MLSLIIAESALERIPSSLTGHPSVTSSAKRLGRYPGRMLLDKSWHFGAMSSLEDRDRRGRPDIVHLCMLAACGTPLYMDNLLRVYVHTIRDMVIEVGGGVRIPKSYHRFAGLMEDLYRDGRIEDDSGRTLAEITDRNFAGLLEDLEPAAAVGMSTAGTPSTYAKVASRIAESPDACVVVGGFPRGHFGNGTSSKLDELYSVDGGPQEAHIVLSRILYECETRIKKPPAHG